MSPPLGSHILRPSGGARPPPVFPGTLGDYQMRGKGLRWSGVTLRAGRERDLFGPAPSWVISLFREAVSRPPTLPSKPCVGFARGGELPEQQRLPSDLLPLHVPVTHWWKTSTPLASSLFHHFNKLRTDWKAGNIVSQVPAPTFQLNYRICFSGLARGSWDAAERVRQRVQTRSPEKAIQMPAQSLTSGASGKSIRLSELPHPCLEKGW